MQIEEIKPSHYVINECREGDKNPAGSGKKQTDSYWFPLSKGYKRLLLVLWIVSSPIIPALTSKYVITYSIFMFIVEFILYLVAIWIYQGFKESSKSSNDNEK